MKRVLVPFLAVSMLLLGVTVSPAVDVNMRGWLQFGFEMTQNAELGPKDGDTFRALQRLRTQVDMQVSENLKGVLFLEIGKTQWGKGPDGGVGSDAYALKTRHSYLDWYVPQSGLKVRMGISAIELPNFVAGENVLGAYGAGITLSQEFNEHMGATLIWLRALNDNGSPDLIPRLPHDSADFFALTLPMRYDGFRLTPWGMAGSMGRNALQFSPGNDSCDLDYLRQGLLPFGANADVLSKSSKDSGTPWWIGVGGELTLFSPFRLGAEIRYGRSELGRTAAWDMASGNGNPYVRDHGVTTFELKRSGWYAGLIAEYQLDIMTPGLILWYTSGDDGNPYNGSESMPYVSELSHRGWNATNFGFSGESDCGVSTTGKGFMGLTNIGTWGAVAQIKDLTVYDKLRHTFKVGYYEGTNDPNMPQRAGMTVFRGPNDHIYMTTKDHAVELAFVTNYKLYENLDMSVDLAYIRLEMNKAVWEPAVGTTRWNEQKKNNYRAGIYFSYAF